MLGGTRRARGSLGVVSDEGGGRENGGRDEEGCERMRAEPG